MKRKNLLRICAILSTILCFELVFVLVVRGQGIGGAYRKNLNLGHQYILDEDYESAVKAFSEAIKANPRSEAYIGLGDAYLGLGEYEKAWESFEDAQKLDGTLNLLEEKFGQTKLHVQDQDGKPVADAEIELNKVSDIGESILMKTDDTGTASDLICPGNYNIVVTKDQYTDTETSVEVIYHKGEVEPIELVAEGSQWLLLTKKELYGDILNFRVDYEYDETGNILSEHATGDKGQIIYDAVYRYGEHMVEESSSNASLPYRLITEYDDTGKVICKKSYNNDKYYSETIFTYEGELLVEEKETYSEDFSTRVTRYNYEDGVLMSTHLSLSESYVPDQISYYSYDDVGNIKEITVYEDDKTNAVGRTKNTYNENGLLQSKEFLSGWDHVPSYTETYEYDEYGNCARTYTDNYNNVMTTIYTYSRLSDISR